MWYLVWSLVAASVALAALLLVFWWQNPRQSFEDDARSDVKVVASLTTSPSRIHKMRDTLRSIVNQSRPPDVVILNLPPVFERTGETYDIPEWLNKTTFPTVIVNRVEKDLGPITKLAPTISIVNPLVDYIWVVDDDQLYHPQELSFLLQKAAVEQGVLCLTGLVRREGRFQESRYTSGKVDVFEAYAGVLIPVDAVEPRSFHTFVTKAIADPDCRTSDDLIVSVYLEHRGVLVQKIYSPIVNINEHWSSRRVLHYGKDKDALSQQQVSTVDRYAAAYPKLLKMLSG